MKPFNFSGEQIAFLGSHRKMTRKGLVERFNTTFDTNYSVTQISGVCKGLCFTTGRTGRFEIGNKPYNTGTKGFMKPNSGSFKKGNMPKNHRPIGSERIDVEGYVLIKTEEPRTWRLKHLVLWEKDNGKLPPGKIVRFRNGDKEDISSENLEMMTQSLNLRLNQNHYREAPDQLKPAVKTLSKIQEKLSIIKNRKKNKNESSKK